jgi:hypothetical protein
MEAWTRIQDPDSCDSGPLFCRISNLESRFRAVSVKFRPPASSPQPPAAPSRSWRSRSEREERLDRYADPPRLLFKRSPQLAQRTLDLEQADETRRIGGR